MQKELKEKLLAKDKWIRGLLMVFFIMAKCLASWLIYIISLFQFANDLLFDKPNLQLLTFSKQLNNYYFQILNFLTFNSEIKPFPFANWPENEKPST